MVESQETLKVSRLTGHLLRLGHLQAQRYFLTEFGSQNLTSLQVGILIVVAERPGIAHRELAKVLHTSKSVLTTATKDILRQGLIERKAADADARVAEYTLSQAGQERTAKLMALLDQTESRLLARLTASQTLTLNGLLRQIIE